MLVELDYWVLKLLGPNAWEVFVDDISRGAYRLEPLTIEDLKRAAEIERQYNDLDLGLVDASVIALCERLGETKVATLDRRDFSVVRPAHCTSLYLLPGSSPTGVYYEPPADHRRRSEPPGTERWTSRRDRTPCRRRGTDASPRPLSARPGPRC